MLVSVLHHFFNFSQHQFVDPGTVFTSKINAAQAKYSNFVGGFDYEVQVKSFQTEGM